MKTPIGEINDKILEIVKDEAMVAKMSECKSPQECYDLVKNQIDIGFEEFKASMDIANSYLKEKESGLLNEEELDQVAGGKSTGIGPITLGPATIHPSMFGPNTGPSIQTAAATAS